MDEPIQQRSDQPLDPKASVHSFSSVSWFGDEENRRMRKKA